MAAGNTRGAPKQSSARAAATAAATRALKLMTPLVLDMMREATCGRVKVRTKHTDAQPKGAMRRSGYRVSRKNAKK